MNGGGAQACEGRLGGLSKASKAMYPGERD